MLLPRTFHSLSIYVGGYSGIVSTLTFDALNLSLTKQWESQKGAFGDAPTWITADHSGRYVFITDETGDFGGVNGSGGVFSASVDSDGSFSYISQAPTGNEPVNSAISKTDTTLLVADYTAGSLDEFSVNPLTGVLSPIQTLLFQGSGPDPVRQTHPYAHQVIYSPTGQYAVVCDLGSDLVRFFSASSPGLVATASLQLPPGSGPRHAAYIDSYPAHHEERSTSSLDNYGGQTFGYIVCELANMIYVTVASSSSFTSAKIIQSFSTLPPNANSSLPFGAGEIVISPDGQYVFASNRLPDQVGEEDDNTIAIFKRDGQTGMLSNIAYVPCGGRHPRSFAMDPSGTWLVVGAQQSNRIIMHRWDASHQNLSMVAQMDFDMPAITLFAPQHYGHT